jgi:predicted anti-sigma-YlaC factor YlaD
MKARGCERELETARAARTGFWTDDLRQHAESCRACAETVAVAGALLEDSAQARAAAPPEAARVWVEARRRARLHLRHRALFWFRALRVVALVYLPAVLGWTLSHQTAVVHEAWKPALEPSFRAEFGALFTGPAEMVALSGVLLAAVCIFMGSWYLLREARTPLHS